MRHEDETSLTWLRRRAACVSFSQVKPGDTVTMQKRVQPGLFPQGKPTCTLPVRHDSHTK